MSLEIPRNHGVPWPAYSNFIRVLKILFCCESSFTGSLLTFSSTPFHTLPTVLPWPPALTKHFCAWKHFCSPGLNYNQLTALQVTTQERFSLDCPQAGELTLKSTKTRSVSLEHSVALTCCQSVSSLLVCKLFSILPFI